MFPISNPNLPIAIILKFNDYTGPSLTNRIPGCVPICPICNTLDGLQERQQLPLKIAWVITIHKNRGLTLSKAWIDIGKSEKTVGVSYVAISPIKMLSNSILEPVTFERSTSLKKSVNLEYRIKEAQLDNLAKILTKY